MTKVDIHDFTQEGVSKIEEPKAAPAEIKFTEYLQESLDKVATSEGFKNYELKVNHGSSVGDGFVGLIYKATIQEIDSDKKLDVVLKFPPFNKARRNDFCGMELFEREILMYNEVLPEFVKFQQEKKIEESEGFYNFPKCYFAEYNQEKDDAVIIMEDLTKDDCTLWDKYVTVDLEHTKLLMAAFGRFNAVSLAIKSQKPQLFQKFRDMKEILAKLFCEGEAKPTVIQGIKQVAETIDESDVESRNKVIKLTNNFPELMKELVNPDLSEPYTVVGHGDCWSNNFMYQYKEGAVQKIVLIDWQISRCCSPVLDLVHFIFSCTDGDLRANHYDELFEIYYQSLKTLLDRLGGDAEKQFPFEALQKHLNQFGKYGIILASQVIPGSSVKSEDLPKRDLIAENTETENPDTFKDFLQFLNIANSTPATKSRMRAALMDAIHYGYL